MKKLIPIALVLVFVLTPTLAFADLFLSDPPDTTYLLGGPDRWDGNFETDTGEPDWHGWTHIDVHSTGTAIWEVSDYEAENMGGHGPGNLAAWCGTTYNNSCGSGYGNGWNVCLIWNGIVPDPAEPTEVRFVARMNVDVEPGYDTVEYVVWHNGSWHGLELWDGVWRDEALDISWTFNPTSYVGPDSNQVRLACRVTSDEVYSDQDCQYDSVGACQLDDVEIFLNNVSVFTDDFQDGDLHGWELLQYQLVGDFTQLWSDLDDADPEHSNTSCQVAFIDDGVVVPGTGGTHCSSYCYGPDGWTFNITAGLDGHGTDINNTGVWNGVISPLLAWQEQADSGRLTFDVYAHMHTFECGYTGYGWTLRATTSPDPADLEITAWEATQWSFFNPDSMPPGPGYFRLDFPLDNFLTTETTWFQIRLDAIEVGPYCWGEYVWDSTPAPYFDNVTVSCWQSETGVPSAPTDQMLAVFPNPFNPRTTVRFTLDQRQQVDISVYDMLGRQVKNLVDNVFAPGTHETIWDGKDEVGCEVASGTYFIRQSAGGVIHRLKVILIK